MSKLSESKSLNLMFEELSDELVHVDLDLETTVWDQLARVYNHYLQAERQNRTHELSVLLGMKGNESRIAVLHKLNCFALSEIMPHIPTATVATQVMLYTAWKGVSADEFVDYVMNTTLYNDLRILDNELK
jgi:hypothetical protein